MYKISSPAGLLSTIPVHLGRYPHQSVVAMMVDGTAVQATLRVDRPDTIDEAWMDTFVSYLAKATFDKVALAIYTDGDGAGVEAQVDRLADYVTAALPVTILTAALITPEYWIDYTDGLRRPALELEVSPVVMEMFANGDGDKNVHTIPAPTPDPEFAAAVEARTGSWSASETEALFTNWNSLLRSGHTPAGPAAVSIVAGFKGGMVRDGLICRIFQEHVGADDYAPILLGTSSAPFDRARYDAGLALVKHLLTLDAPPAHRASLLAALGWLHWHAGRGHYASECLDAGLAADPDHALCSLLLQLVTSGKLSPVASVKSNWLSN